MPEAGPAIIKKLEKQVIRAWHKKEKIYEEEPAKTTKICSAVPP